MVEKLYRLSEACLLLGLHPRTIQKWDKQGKIHVVRTQGGRRRIPESEVLRLQGKLFKREVIGYARVSSATQRDDLERQVEYLQHHEIHEIIKDIGSGLNDKRKGYRKLLSRVLANEITKVVVVYQDRLTRFGFDILEDVFASHGTQIEVLNENENKTPQQELVDDLITLIAHFSGKLYGLRSHKYKEVVSHAKDLFTVT